MVPYSLAFLLVWILLLIGWVLLGAPLGPDQIVDDPSQTILVIEGTPIVASGLWTEPVDLDGVNETFSLLVPLPMGTMMSVVGAHCSKTSRAGRRRNWRRWTA